MKLRFLGTSHGVPAEDRFCNCILLDIDRHLYVFDAGAPIADLLLRYGYRFEELEGVFITHMHGDHFCGLPALVDLSNWYFKNADYQVLLPEEKGIDLLRSYVSTVENAPLREGIRLSCYDEGEIYKDERIRVSAVRTDHIPGHPTYGFLIEAGEKRIYLSGDMRADLADFPTMLYEKETDLLVVELAHQEPKTLLPHLQRCKTKAIYLNHVHPLEKAMQVVVESDGIAARIHMAEDGDSVSL